MWRSLVRVQQALRFLGPERDEVKRGVGTRLLSLDDSLRLLPRGNRYRGKQARATPIRLLPYCSQAWGTKSESESRQKENLRPPSLNIFQGGNLGALIVVSFFVLVGYLVTVGLKFLSKEKERTLE